MSARRRLDTAVALVEQAGLDVEAGLTPAELSAVIGETCRLLGRIHDLLVISRRTVNGWDPAALYDAVPSRRPANEAVLEISKSLAEAYELVAYAELTENGHPWLARIGIRS